MKWNVFVFLVIITTGSSTDENGEKEDETTNANVREMREYDQEVCIYFFK